MIELDINGNKEAELKKKSVSLPKQIWLFGFISLLADITSEMLYPIIPLFLISQLGGSATQLGFIESIAEGIASFVKYFSGTYADKNNKGKGLIILGYTFSSIAKPLMGFSHFWWQILVARGFDRFGKGMRTSPRDAFISRWVPKNLLGKAFGVHRGMDTVGAVIGPLLAIYFLNLFNNDLVLIFKLAAIPSAIAICLTFFIKVPPIHKERLFAGSKLDTAIDATQVLDAKPVKKRAKLFSPDLPKSFWVLLIVWMFFSITNSSDAFLILKANLVLKDFKYVVLLYVVFNISYAGLSPHLGKVSDTIPKKYLLSFGLLLFSAVYLGFAHVSQPGLYPLLFLMYGIYMAATEGVVKALVAEIVPPDKRGSAIGSFDAAVGFSLLISSVVAGVLWDKISPTAPFYYGATGALVGAIAILFYDKA